MNKVFRYESYKQYLRDWVANGEGKMGDIAREAGCHRTYLSQVINGKSELTTDHAINLCDFFQFNSLESEYFLSCHLYERSRLKSAKDRLRKKMTVLRQNADQVSKRVQHKDPARLEDPSLLGAYYADPYASLTHLATGCPSLQTARSIADKFGIPENKVQNILEHLTTMGLISRSGMKFQHSGKGLHLERQSPFTRINHLNWRLQAAEDSYNPKSIHFTNVFSIGADDAVALREHLLQFIENQSKHIAQSGNEELMVFCCDLFKPGR